MGRPIKIYVEWPKGRMEALWEAPREALEGQDGSHMGITGEML